MFKHLLFTAALGAASMAYAGDGTAPTAMEMTLETPVIQGAYARAATPNARSGAAFMTIVNPTEADDRLIAVRSDVAMRVELHTHIAGDDGVMQMREVEGGFAIPAGGAHLLARGGDHIMFMGLKESFDQGKEIPVTLVFETAGEVEAVIPVDLQREDSHGDAGGHGSHGSHGAHGGHGTASN